MSDRAVMILCATALAITLLVLGQGATLFWLACLAALLFFFS